MSKWTWPFLALAAAVAGASCESVPLTAASGTDMTLIANPTFVPANGGRSVVTAILVEPAGTFVPDGTTVFCFTDLGYVDPEIKTRVGVARANFVSDSRSGTAHVECISGGPAQAPSASPTPPGGTGSSKSGSASSGLIATDENRASVEITIGSALPDHVLVTADPQRITRSSAATIIANVFDANGNPVQNVPVSFSITGVTGGGGVLEETLDSGGRPRFTDSNGQAFDTLRTRAAAGGVQKRVTVAATTPNEIGNDVDVFVN